MKELALCGTSQKCCITVNLIYMKQKCSKHFYLQVCFFLFSTTTFALAKPDLEKGMSNAEVLKLWGAPDSKIEYETKRVDKWNYGQDYVLFKSGKVTAWAFQGVEADVRPQKPLRAKAEPRPIKPRKSQKSASDNEVDAIMQDLIGKQK